jgi:hypothetical protein
MLPCSYFIDIIQHINARYESLPSRRGLTAAAFRRSGTESGRDSRRSEILARYHEVTRNDQLVKL